MASRVVSVAIVIPVTHFQITKTLCANIVDFSETIHLGHYKYCYGNKYESLPIYYFTHIGVTIKEENLDVGRSGDLGVRFYEEVP